MDHRIYCSRFWWFGSCWKWAGKLPREWPIWPVGSWFIEIWLQGTACKILLNFVYHYFVAIRLFESRELWFVISMISFMNGMHQQGVPDFKPLDGNMYRSYPKKGNVNVSKNAGISDQLIIGRT